MRETPSQGHGERWVALEGQSWITVLMLLRFGFLFSQSPSSWSPAIMGDSAFVLNNVSC